MIGKLLVSKKHVFTYSELFCCCARIHMSNMQLVMAIAVEVLIN